MVHEPDQAALGAAGVIAVAVAVVVAERAAAVLGDWGGAGLVFMGVALGLFGAIATVITRRLRRPNWLAGLCVLIGVPVGVLADVSLDAMLFSNDRNLLPFEIAFLWIIASAPAIVASVSTAQLDRLLGLGPPRP